MARYSHFRPRFAHREELGFSSWHLTLEDAQAWQVSLNLGAAQPGAPGEGVIDGEDISEVRMDSVGGVQDGSILRNETMDRVFQECGNGGVFLALWIGSKGLRS